jgi:quercetin dioxygenase-like cupin family protein
VHLTRSNEAKQSTVSHDSWLRKSVFDGCRGHILQVSTTQIRPGQSTKPHIHSDAFEYYFCLSGCLDIHVGDERCAIEAGDLLVVEPGEIHSIANRSDKNVDLFYFLVLAP